MVNMVGSVIPQLLLAREGFTATDLTLSIIFANIIVPFAYMLSGRLSDSFGRKPVLLFAGSLVLIVMSGLFAVLGSGVPIPFFGLVAIVFFVQCVNGRSEERRLGKECVSTCRSRWSRYHYKKI